MTFSARTSLIASAMMQEEGWFASNSLARHNNNPGNIRNWGQVPTMGGFAHFPSALDGYTALLTDIAANSALTLRAFLNKYAPAADNNNTFSYLQLVCTLTGLGPDELVGG